MAIRLDGTLGVSATGNITTDNYFIGNGSQLTGITTGNIDLTAVTTNIIPSSNVALSLGNSTNQWKDLWLSNSTLYLNSLPLSTVEVGNVATIEFNGNPIVVSSNTAPPQSANISTTAAVVANEVVANSFSYSNGAPFTGYTDSDVSTYLASGNNTAGYSTTGNVTADFFIGDGSLITNLPAGNYGNANVEAYLPTSNTIIAINSNIANTNSNVANLTTALGNTNSNVANNTANIVTLNATVANLATTSSLANTNSNVANLTTALGNTNSNVINLDNAIANTNSNVANLTISLSNTNSNVANTNSNVANVATGVIDVSNALNNTNSNLANVSSNVATLQGQVYTNTNVAAYLGNANTTGNIYATNMTVANTVTATTFIGNFQGNITGNLVVPGANTWVLYNDNGNAGADIGFRYDAATEDITVGNTVTANFFVGDGSQLTGLPAAYGNANVEAYLPSSNVILGIDGNVNNVIISLNNTNSNVSNTNANVATLNNTVANLATSSSLANTNSNVANLTTSLTGTNSNVANTNSNVANLTLTVANLATTSSLANTDANVANTNSNVANLTLTVANLATTSSLANTNSNVANTNSNVANLTLTVANLATTSSLANTNANVANIASNVTTLQGQVYANANAQSYLASNANVVITTTGNITTTANVVGAYLYGDGSNITGLPASYGNADVEAYLPTSPTIIAINSNVANTNSNVANTNSNVANLVTITTSTNANVANTNSNVANLTTSLANTNSNVANLVTITTNTDSNVANLSTALTNTNSNVANTNSNVANLTTSLANTNANVANTNSNVANLTTSLTGINSNVANTNANVANLTTSLANTNANVANIASNVTTLQGQVYTNANVANYLPTYTGNLTAGNVVFTGNLLVQGTTTTVDSNNVSINDLVFNVANNANAAIFANGAGLGVGTVNSEYATFLWNSTSDTWTTSNNLSAIGNVQGTYILGNGSQLTGLPASYGNSNVASYLPTYTGNLSGNNLTLTGNISTTGNITGNYLIGDGSLLTNLPAGDYSNANVVSLLSAFGSNTISTTGNINAGNLSLNGNIASGNNAILFSSAEFNVLVNGGVALKVDPQSDVGYVALGTGFNTAGTQTVGIGFAALASAPGAQSIAVGTNAGNFGTGTKSIAIGQFAGAGSFLGTKLGVSSIALGAGAAAGGSANNVIVLNATGSNFTPTTSQASSFYVNPVRNDTGNVTNVVYYNTTTKEVTYGPAGSSYGNANVQTYLGSNANVVITTTGNITTTANISGAYILGNGSQLTGLPASYSNADVATYLASNANVTITTTGNITTTANISATNNITANGNVIINGTIGTGNISGANNISGITLLASNMIQVGANVTTLPNTVAQFGSNVNSYSQITFQNLSNGTDATSDIVLTTNTGNDTVNFADFGIINSAYDPATPTNSLGNVVYASDSYVYAQGNSSNTTQSGGNLVLGATVDTKNVKIFAGGNSNLFVTATFTSTAANLKALNVAGVSNLGPMSNVIITGGTSGQVLRTDGAGNLTWTTVAGGNSTAIVNGTSNVNIATSGGNITMAVGGSSSFNLSNSQIAIGAFAGQTSQSTLSVALGSLAAQTSQGTQAVAVGYQAGQTTQGASSVAVGREAGANTQGTNAVAVGYLAGNSSQGSGAIAMGWQAGLTTQGTQGVAIGQGSGATTQGASSIAIGWQTGLTTQGANSVAIGASAGLTSQGANAVAIGRAAGGNAQGANSVAIGAFAGGNNQVANSIIINASGANLNASNAGFYATPVRNDSSNVTNAVYYNTTTKEVTYGPGSPTYINKNTISGNITLTLAQGGTFLYSTTAAADIVTIPSNANVAFPVGTTITLVLQGVGSLALTPQANVSVYLGGNSTSTTRTVSPYGIATLLQVAADTWFINGTGVY